ncbi:MAG TPA: phosphotransferase [Chthoniobacteraceae bacterium]|jgi:hypothetical protein
MVSTLIDQTVSRFPRFADQEIVVVPLEKGGSDRNFYRIGVSDHHSLILAKYGQQRDENRHYVAIARFLAEVGVRVPEIYFHEESEGLIWMEDLGDQDLWSYRQEPWEMRRVLYEDALDQLFTLHSRAHTMHDGLPALQVAFDAELYLWEQNYFLEHCLSRYFELDPAVVEEHCDRERLNGIAVELAAEPRVFVHRDFQSQNIVIKEGAACFIDFQGMRPGLAQYDLASLLYDPYVKLTAAERAELLGYYMAKLPQTGARAGADFERLFLLCAMQRLMQALGAYGFLGLVKGRTHFLDHIPPAMANLREVLAQIPGLERLTLLLEPLESRE